MLSTLSEVQGSVVLHHNELRKSSKKTCLAFEKISANMKTTFENLQKSPVFNSTIENYISLSTPYHGGDIKQADLENVQTLDQLYDLLKCSET